MNAGSQAERFSDWLRPGMAIASVNDVGTGGKSYDEVLGLIQAGGRPLSMVFAWPPGSAVVRFTEPGSLGLQLLELPGQPSCHVVLSDLVPNSQA